MKRVLIILAGLILLPIMVKAQEIQWASEVDFQFNQFSETEYSAEKILGEPDAAPYGQMSKNAFRINAEMGFGSVTLRYENPQPVSQVIVVESYLPGRVSKIMLYDKDDNSYTIYETKPQSHTAPFNVLAVKIDKTPYAVQKVAVHLNTYTAKGWAQIDAVGICEGEYEGEIIPGAATSIAVAEAEEIVIIAEKERLSDKINTKYLESKPVISPDGKTLFFARKNHPENVGGKRDDQDIYVSDLIGKEWTLALNPGKPLMTNCPTAYAQLVRMETR